MNPTSTSRYLSITTSAALLYGIVAALAGGLWFFIAVRFLDGDTLSILHYGSFILLGPVVSLVAGFLALKNARNASWLLILGGIATSAYGLQMLQSDAGVFPLLLVAVPMLTLGFLLRHAAAVEMPATSEQAPLDAQQRVSILKGAGLFFVGLVGAYAFFTYMIMENILGLRQQHQVWGIDFNRMPDTYAMLIFTAPTLLLPVLVKWLKLRWEWLFGIWAALALGFLIIWVR